MKQSIYFIKMAILKTVGQKILGKVNGLNIFLILINNYVYPNIPFIFDGSHTIFTKVVTSDLRYNSNENILIIHALFKIFT